MDTKSVYSYIALGGSNEQCVRSFLFCWIRRMCLLISTKTLLSINSKTLLGLKRGIKLIQIYVKKIYT